MKSTLSIATVLIGVLLLVASASWGALFPPTNSWTSEKSEQLSEMGSELNRLKFAIVQAQNNPSMHSGENPAELKQQYDDLRTQYDELHQEFLNAKESPERTSSLLRWVGIALIGIGAMLALIIRSSSN